ncbi:MAG: aldo/keto reductase [Gammaproteobacteria bacterium]|nr:aldo/keto reductase [Gammaproteobacteria bacterium]
MNRIALGTAQFGQAYGVANHSGQLSLEEIAATLDFALLKGIDTLDTAIAYGDSEKRLGEAGVSAWKVITKLPAMPENCRDLVGFIKNEVTNSLNRLRISSIYGLLLHCPKQLLEKKGDLLYETLVNLKTEKWVNKIGISIYSPDELDKVCALYNFDIIQAPYNVIDQRIVTSGWLNRLKESNIEVHTRSMFLQGLLLMPINSRPKFFNRWDQLWNRWNTWLQEQNISPLQACLNMAISQPHIDRLLIGVDSLYQLQQILDNVGKCAAIPPDTLMSNDTDLINPSNWSLV